MTEKQTSPIDGLAVIYCFEIASTRSALISKVLSASSSTLSSLVLPKANERAFPPYKKV
ncbi:hypothetical protein KIN20_029262 [Parelaphostrongylus tenuis]|uniref:Uncharacterized protein n=1 Tax=Parelaphostrongylus tenuis TaxID=148309 RepID=A0AAD5WFU6_PARTN|nr:hypothetical protein KIN20_029262 [Parelaphostrongylus tenuis]